MSVQTRTEVFSENNPVEIQIGNYVYKGAMALGKAFQAADGGKEVIRARTVANSYLPQGFTQLPKMSVYTCLIDSRHIEDDMISQNYYNPNGAQTNIPNFRYVERNTAGQERTVIVKSPSVNASSECMIASMEEKKTNLDKPTVEVVIYAYGKENKGTWTNP